VKARPQIPKPGSSATTAGISVSCLAPGLCALGSEYTDHQGHTELLVADER
jgi:hypothetical protein